MENSGVRIQDSGVGIQDSGVGGDSSLQGQSPEPEEKPRRKYVLKNQPEPEVTTEYVDPEKILYKFGLCRVYLTGFYAWLYRGMIWMYGEEEAARRFWFIFHKEEPEKKERRRYPARQHRQAHKSSIG